jgi:tRNA(Arg) A34 adenosine deaminase TadA
MHAFDTRGLNHRLDVCGGVLEQDCADQLLRFFRGRRS